jgi:hypothetical protein
VGAVRGSSRGYEKSVQFFLVAKLERKMSLDRPRRCENRVVNKWGVGVRSSSSCSAGETFGIVTTFRVLDLLSSSGEGRQTPALLGWAPQEQPSPNTVSSIYNSG